MKFNSLPTWSNHLRAYRPMPVLKCPPGTYLIVYKLLEICEVPKLNWKYSRACFKTNFNTVTKASSGKGDSWRFSGIEKQYI